MNASFVDIVIFTMCYLMPGGLREVIGRDTPGQTTAREHPNTPMEKFCISENPREKH